MCVCCPTHTIFFGFSNSVVRYIKCILSQINTKNLRGLEVGNKFSKVTH